MIYRLYTHDFACRLVIISTGLPKTSGTIYAYIRRSSDGYWLKADGTWTANTTAPTGADVPTATHTKGGVWKYTLTSAITAALTIGETLTCTMQDSETDASVTVAGAADKQTVDVATVAIGDLVESQRGRHTWQQELLYVSPNTGNDTTGNGSKALPYATVTKALSMVTKRHTCIFLLADAPSGTTTLTENVTVNKAYTFIRGPGRDFIWTRSGNGPVITVSADGVELSGFQINNSNASATSHGVSVASCDFFKAHRIWLNATQGTGIVLTSVRNSQIENCTFQGTGVSATGHGLVIDSTSSACDYVRVKDCSFYDVQGDAIRISGGAVDTPSVEGCRIHGSTGWGVNVLAGTHVGISYNLFGSNASGNINDQGTGTHSANNEQWATTSVTAASLADAVWDEALSGHTTDGTAGAAAARQLGLNLENCVIESLTGDSDGRMLTGRRRLYNSAANATTNDGVTGLVASYAIVVAYNSDGIPTSYKETRTA